MRHGSSITTNQRLFPTFRGNGKTIKDGDSQTSFLTPIFSEERGESVHRLTRDFATDLRDTFKISLCRLYVLTRAIIGPVLLWLLVIQMPRNELKYGFYRETALLIVLEYIFEFLMNSSTSFKQRLSAEFHGQRR